MHKVLVLEDNDERIKEFKKRFLENKCDGTFVEEASDCISLIEKEEFECIFLDHDLGGKVYVCVNEINTGSEVARWMNSHSHKNENTPVVIHSFNNVGSAYMNRLIKNSFRIPSIWKENIFKDNVKFNDKEENHEQ